jgi:hypothetical protein
MSPCEVCQLQLLNHLYGLLDVEESQALTGHLQGCAACRAALNKLETKRKLLAAAAKAEFPDVRFQPPAPAKPVEVFPIRPKRSLPGWVRWAVAAGVLVLVGTAGWSWKSYRDIRRPADQARAEAEQLTQEWNELTRQRDARAKRYQQRASAFQARIAKLQDERRRRRLRVHVTGPETIQAGARNQFLIRTENLANEPVAAQVDVRLRDAQKKEVVFERKGLATIQGQCQLILPPDLEQKPGTRLDMEVVARRPDTGAILRVEAEKLPVVAPLYLTHLTTDKPMYQPGEVVFFRSLTLERFRLKPVDRPLNLAYQVTDPKGTEVFRAQGTDNLRYGKEKGFGAVLGPDGRPVRGIGTGAYRIPPAAAGGVYTLTVTATVPGAPGTVPFVQEQRRQFLVNRYQKPRLNKELEYTRKSYGPGDAVVAACRVARVEGGTALANQNVEATVRVDGKVMDKDGNPAKGPTSGIALRTDAQGTVNVRFKLPAKINMGEASLSVAFTDGANHETLVRPIPVVLKKLQVEFFPEGGDLVAGARNRVYFQVRTPLGKPAELKGRIVNARGETLARVATLHDDHHPEANQGMGAFELNGPTTAAKYELKIDSPAGIEGRYELPKVKADGVVLHLPRGVVTDEIPVVLRNGKAARRLLVGIYCRGRLLDHQTVRAQPNEEIKIRLKPQDGVGGVYRVTVFEERAEGKDRLRPVAERLLYRRPPGRVDLAIRADQKVYTPGDRVRLRLTATNEHQEPAPAILLVRVVDKSVLKLADEKTARTMPTHFLLTSEVRSPDDLENADFLVADNARAGEALDLLLGTQGWRRFAEQHDPQDLLKKHQQDAERLVRLSGQQPLAKGVFAQAEVLADGDKFQPQIDMLNQQIARSNGAAAQEAQIISGVILQKTSAIDQAHAVEARVGEDEKIYLHGLRDRCLLWAVFLALGGLVALAVGSGIADRGWRGGWAYLLGGLCGLGFLGALVAWIILAPADRHKKAMALADEKMKDKAAWAGKRPLPGMAVKEAARFEGKAVEEGLGDAGEKPAAPVPMPIDGFALRKVRQIQFGMEAEGRRHGLRAALARGGRGPLLGEKKAAKRAKLDADADDAKEKKPFGGANKANEAELDKKMPALNGLSPFVVREYAHQHQPARGNVRTDFAETLYWHPVLVLPNGKGEIAFNLCDSVTTFQVEAFAHTLDGRLGAATAEVQSRLPFTVEPKLPLEVTSTDKVTIPVAVANRTDLKRSVKVETQTQGLDQAGAAKVDLELKGNQSRRLLFHFKPALVEGRAKLLLRGLCEPFAADAIERTVTVVPDGFPIVGSHSGMLEKVDSRSITLPKSWLPGTLRLHVQAYPSTLADLQKGLEGMLREPYGCFEQTSSSNYPNVLVLDYLKESDQTNPDLVRRCRELLDRGYQKLTSFECLDSGRQKRRGYEWFGGTAPPHEALTAYGLLEFRDMARVHPVDKAMLERTRKYLLAQKDGQGGFRRNARALDAFGSAPPHITNAYIVWALTEGGKQDDVEKELAALAKQAKTSKDPYFLALVANSLLNRGKGEDGLDLLQRLTKSQKDDGRLDGAEMSITHSGGRDLQIETTSLSVLAWLKANNPKFLAPVRKAAKWIGEQRGAFGAFGSTQATVLALKALIAYTQVNKRTAAAGEMTLYVNGKAVERKAFPAGAQDVLTLTLPKPDALLKPGKNQVRVEITGKNVFPYTLSWSYRTVLPANADHCPVHLATKLDRTAAKEAETVRLTAAVANRTGKGQGMAVAVIGLPGGLTLPEDMKQLKDLVRPRDQAPKSAGFRSYLSAFEIRGRELVLYWRDLAPGEKIRVGLDLICRIPGTYRGPASRAYLYYNADKKFWTEPLAVEIAPQEEK